MRTPKFFAVNLPAAALQSIKTILILFVLAMPVVGFAQEKSDGDDKPDSINEQTIYVPYDKLRDVFERDGRGVFLPYDKFKKLWSQARDNQPKKAELTAPLGALITDCLLYTSPSPRDKRQSRMPSSA